jgi:hypothetical protein
MGTDFIAKEKKCGGLSTSLRFGRDDGFWGSEGKGKRNSRSSACGEG